MLVHNQHPQRPLRFPCGHALALQRVRWRGTVTMIRVPWPSPLSNSISPSIAWRAPACWPTRDGRAGRRIRRHEAATVIADLEPQRLVQQVESQPRVFGPSSAGRRWPAPRGPSPTARRPPQWAHQGSSPMISTSVRRVATQLIAESSQPFHQLPESRSSGRSPKMKLRMSRITPCRASMASSTRCCAASGASVTSSGTSSSESVTA